MTKLKIQEIIVVEGKDDTRRLQEVVDADTIETIGSAINEDILMQIEHAQETIMEVVPQAKHAFLPRKQARPRKQGSLGVEHASDEAILEALKKVVTPAEKKETTEITRQILVAHGLIAGAKAKEKREKLGDELRIGYTNGKQLEKRLKMFRITPEEFVQAMKKVEEQHE